MEITAQYAEENKMSFFDIIKHYKEDVTEEEAESILWNETCYPFSTAIAIRQIYEYFNN
jgi:hypothetical protein